MVYKEAFRARRLLISILDMKYYNSKFLVQRSSKMGPSVQKYMNFDDFIYFMSETLILQF